MTENPRISQICGQGCAEYLWLFKHKCLMHLSMTSLQASIVVSVGKNAYETKTEYSWLFK